MCVMCSKSVPTLFQNLFYDHIPTFLYIFMKYFLLLVHVAPSSDELQVWKELMQAYRNMSTNALGHYVHQVTYCHQYNYAVRIKTH